jgi:hypothetical protein
MDGRTLIHINLIMPCVNTYRPLYQEFVAIRRRGSDGGTACFN